MNSTAPKTELFFIYTQRAIIYNIISRCLKQEKWGKIKFSSFHISNEIEKREPAKRNE